ncbi:Alg9-like mannosyltransferase family-domain-containing protein [Blastocladiella britannica]|nr:Alg9-like mannosyltransferase family-domain-containing protein [Blastocladiella britannica]
MDTRPTARPRVKDGHDTVQSEPLTSPPGSVRIFALLVVFRVWNAVQIATSFSPDEYWQGLEIAHWMAFGFGAITWEWLPGTQIRGFAHPLFFAAGYKALGYFGVESTPLLQGIIAAVCDYYTWKLSYLFHGPRVSRWVLFASCMSWFHWFALTRALSNSMEGSLLVAALYYWHTRPAKYTLSIALMGMTAVLRPTILPLLAIHLGLAPPPRRSLARMLATIVVLAMGFLAASVSLDAHFYHRLYADMGLPAGHPSRTSLPLVPLNFVKFNILHKIAKFYGTHPWHWYLTQGWTQLLGPYLLVIVPYVVVSCMRSAGSTTRPQRSSAWMIKLMASATAVYSLLAHKEFRFLACMVPLAMVYVGQGMAFLTAPSATIGRVASASWYRTSTVPRRALVLSALVISWALALYTTRWHQRGVLDASLHLRAVSANGTADGIRPFRIYWMTPCHSAPAYAYLGNKNVRLGYLTCDPPIGIPNPDTYLSEMREFYDDVDGALQSWDWKKRWATSRPMLVGVPSAQAHGLESEPADRLVVFENLLVHHARTGVLKDYVECARFFNSHWHDEETRGGDVIVLCLMPTADLPDSTSKQQEK